MWRDLFRRLSLRSRTKTDMPSDPVEPDTWALVSRATSPLSEVLEQVEQTALAVYAAHGLPTRTGHYRRGRRARGWTFLGEDMTPEARWAALQERPPEDGWRYGVLADIGRTGPQEVRTAADLLTGCAHLKNRLAGRTQGDPVQDMEMAVRLGADWRSLERDRVRGGGTPLRLTAPDDVVSVAVKPKRASRSRQLKPPR